TTRQGLSRGELEDIHTIYTRSRPTHGVSHRLLRLFDRLGERSRDIDGPVPLAYKPRKIVCRPGRGPGGASRVNPPSPRRGPAETSKVKRTYQPSKLVRKRRHGF